MKVEIDTYIENATLRAWAWKNGFMPADYGTVPWEIHRAFDAALQTALEAAAAQFIAQVHPAAGYSGERSRGQHDNDN